MRQQLEAPGEPARRASKTGGWLQQPRIRLGAIIALAVAAGIIAWVVVDRGGSSKPTTSPSRLSAARVSPVGLSLEGLRAQSRSLRQPIYWAGPRAGYTYELTRISNGSIYVRYLPAGVKVGANGAKYLIIATYPFANALKALKQVAPGKGIPVPGGGIAVVDQKYPKSVHMAFPGVNFQIEVYDPSPSHALHVAVSGAISPVK